jgi:ribosomal protein S18 acetylase RimI-like enzyme
MGKLYGELDPWQPEELEKIHQASLEILENVGVWVGSDHVLNVLEGSDARIDRDKQIVKFPAAMVQERMRNAPGCWDRACGRPTEFSVSADCGAYNVWDYTTRRARPTAIRDFVDVPRLVQSLEHIDSAGNLIYSADVPPAVGDMIAYRHIWTHTQKKGGGGLGRSPSCCHALLPKSFDHLCRMLEVKIGKEKMQTDPEFSFFMGAASPLRFGRDVLDMAMHTIQRGQVVGIGGNCNCGSLCGADRWLGSETLSVLMEDGLRIEPYDPAAAAPGVQRAAIHDLIVQPAAPWFSEVERRHLEGALSGEFAAVACDRFWIARIGAEPVANVYFSIAAGAPEIGLLAFAITAPAYRGRGIGRLLLREALADFEAMGGACMHLATANPTAHRLYESCGFHDYQGHIMRFLAPAADRAGFDRAYFEDCGLAQVRRGHWGDAARIAMLYVSPHPWFLRDYVEQLYNHPAIVQTRCASILPALMINTTERPARANLTTGGLWVLENPARRLVGAATVTPPDLTAQAHAPIVDFLVAPAYMGQATDLLVAALVACRSGGAERVHCCVAACDREKIATLLQLGFCHEATLVGQLKAGHDRFDLHIYVRLPG